MTESIKQPLLISPASDDVFLPGQKKRDSSQVKGLFQSIQSMPMTSFTSFTPTRAPAGLLEEVATSVVDAVSHKIEKIAHFEEPKNSTGVAIFAGVKASKVLSIASLPVTILEAAAAPFVTRICHFDPSVNELCERVKEGNIKAVAYIHETVASLEEDAGLSADFMTESVTDLPLSITATTLYLNVVNPNPSVPVQALRP